MVKTPREAIDFLQHLVQASQPSARKEYKALCEFAQKNLHLDTLEAWDIAFASEKLRQHRYAISQEELRPYFPFMKQCHHVVVT